MGVFLRKPCVAMSVRLYSSGRPRAGAVASVKVTRTAEPSIVVGHVDHVRESTAEGQPPPVARAEDGFDVAGQGWWAPA
jgi:hypothetical protein